jgi:DNA-binding MarR family transcriptional regulator
MMPSHIQIKPVDTPFPQADPVTSSTEARLRLQDYLPYRLSVAANAVSQLIARAYKEQFGLTVPQWRLIAVLADAGPLTQQALCGRTVMDKVTVMRAAHGLVHRRLVKRLPNPRDSRSHRLILTASGGELYNKIVPLALKYESQLVAGIKASEIARLDRLLRHIERAAACSSR